MYDVIVIGGGPAGMMAAIKASEKHKRVLLIEQNNTLGKKLLLTGNGRCNLTNNKNEKEFISEINCNPNFLKSSIYNFGPKKIIEFFNSKGLKLKEEKEGKIFPVSNKSNDVLEVLLSEIRKKEIQINFNEKALNIKDNTLYTDKGKYDFKKLVIATGGASYPQTGSNINNYKLIPDEVTSLYPVETYLKTLEKMNLSGISFNNANIRYGKISKTGDLLFTHRGISGPLIFKISEYVYKNLKENNIVNINLLPKINIKEIINNNRDTKLEIITILKKHLPERFCLYILNKFDIPKNTKISSISKNDVENISNSIHNLKLEIENTGRLEEAIITGGGVDVKFINKDTLNSKINPNIFYAGEVLDVHGPIGGYNITIALSTGYTVGENI